MRFGLVMGLKGRRSGEAGSEIRTRVAVLPGFEEFFRDAHAPVYRALILVTRDRYEAEELVQEAFCRAWERWSALSQMENPRGYLYRIALNRHFQKRRRVARALKNAARVHAPGDPLEAVEAAETLERGFLLLPPRQRAALLLTAVLGFSSVEAAEIMGIKPGTVRRLASQASDHLRTGLEVDDE
jgi:RNA polymerase sigma-70 factor (ECF subfamily)